jgi:hypothetical protein
VLRDLLIAAAIVGAALLAVLVLLDPVAPPAGTPIVIGRRA